MPQPTLEVEFKDKYGDTRVLRRTQSGIQLKRGDLTPVLALSQELSKLVGQRIKGCREARGWTLEALCLRAGLRSATPKSRMWEIENATRREGVTLGTLYALALALDVDVCALLPPMSEVRSVVVETREQSTVGVVR